MRNPLVTLSAVERALLRKRLRTPVLTFLALLELVRLQAILLRQERLFGEILVKKHEMFDTVFGEGGGAVRDDWK